MLNQYKAIISTHCSEYQADREREREREGVSGRVGVMGHVCKRERRGEKDQLKLSKFPFRGIILAEPWCLGCLEGN